MAASAVTCALPPRGWGQGLAAAARSIRPSPQLRPPCCDWLRGGPAESVLANGRPREVRMLGGTAPPGFPGARAPLPGAGRPGFPGARARVQGAGRGRGAGAEQPGFFFFFFPLCDPEGPGVGPENGNPHPRETADIRAGSEGRGPPCRVHVGAQAGPAWATDCVTYWSSAPTGCRKLQPREEKQLSKVTQRTHTHKGRP